MSKAQLTRKSGCVAVLLTVTAAIVTVSVMLTVMSVVVNGRVDAGAEGANPLAREFQRAVTGLAITGVVASVLLFGGLGLLALALVALDLTRAVVAGESSDDNYRRYVEGEYGHLIQH